MIDKIIEKLRKEYISEVQCDTDNGFNRGIYKAVGILKQVAAEENNGWISVNEKPTKSDDYLVYYHKKYDSSNFETNWHGICSFIESSGGWQTEEGETILAWQPLQPYKEG